MSSALKKPQKKALRVNLWLRWHQLDAYVHTCMYTLYADLDCQLLQYIGYDWHYDQTQEDWDKVSAMPKNSDLRHMYMYLIYSHIHPPIQMYAQEHVVDYLVLKPKSN